MGKVLAGARGFCGAFGTAAAAAREAAGTGLCGSGRPTRPGPRWTVGSGATRAVFRAASAGPRSACVLRRRRRGLHRGDLCSCSEPASLPPPTHPDPSEALWLHLLPIPQERHVTSLLTPFLSASLVPATQALLGDPSCLLRQSSILVLSVSALFSSPTPDLRLPDPSPSSLGCCEPVRLSEPLLSWLPAEAPLLLLSFSPLVSRPPHF